MSTPLTLCISPENAVKYRFTLENPCIIEMDGGEGCVIIPGPDDHVGMEEIKIALLSSHWLQISLLPEGWIENHYIWIIWKLAALEMAFGEEFLERPFSIENVVKQLRFRYDYEIIGGRRSILRKIMEQDDIPQKTMVLCISRISTDFTFFTLTDGWYSIDSFLDTAGQDLLRRGLLRVGCKIVVHGAELNGNPSPISPLEINSQTDKVRLKIHTNMMRRSPRYAKLGLCRCIPPPPTPLSCILPGGGVIAAVEVGLARRYPLLYMEKDANGKNIIRNERAHERRLRGFDLKREKILQGIYLEVEREFDKKPKCNIPQEVLSLMEDNGEMLNNLTKEQEDAIELYRKLQEEKVFSIQQEVKKRISQKSPFYEPSQMLKMGVVDKSGEIGLVTIWRPKEDLLSILKEGSIFRISYLQAAGVRNGRKHLTCVKQTRWEGLKYGGGVSAMLLARTLAPLAEQGANGGMASLWGEIDFVAIVVQVCNASNNQQTVYLTDNTCGIICMKFFPSAAEFAVDDIITRGSSLIICNARWRGDCGGFNTVHVTAHTLFTKSAGHVFYEDLENLRKSIPDYEAFLLKCDEKLQFLRCPTGRNDPPNISFASPNVSSCVTPSTSPNTKRKLRQQSEAKTKLQYLHSYSSPPALQALGDASPSILRPFKGHSLKEN